MKISLMLYIFAGLPGSGKSTIAKRLSQAINALYLRIDTVEQGLRDLCGMDVTSEGYRLSYRIAKDNLSLGRVVIADSCNPITVTRDEWEKVARESDSAFLHLEIICSDQAEHRSRVESRLPEVASLTLPTWKEVITREYHPWDRPRLTIDTAGITEDEAFKRALRMISGHGASILPTSSEETQEAVVQP